MTCIDIEWHCHYVVLSVTAIQIFELPVFHDLLNTTMGS